jgi:hypothetical protein
MTDTAKKAIALAQRAKNLALKSCTQFVRRKAGLDKIEHFFDKILRMGCPSY